MATKTKATKNSKPVNRIEGVADAPLGHPEIVTFRVVGSSPLLQNNPAKFIGVVEESTLGQKKQYNDEDEAALRVYQDDDGHYVHPTQAFIKAMTEAGKGLKFGKVFATKAVMSVFIAEPHSLILDATGKPATKYAIDRQPVVVGKARILRCRPRWDNWQMDVALDIDTAFITPEQVKQLLTLAGRKIGIGDYRPQKGGGFGRFSVE